ncbi:DUF4230 domain-containing protein [uncultured Anaerococcus sp.]|uniref:DUF4230 domain-containing protein n=1 Tax=uncultured Anaerococcus sp. TaxID=293428 RepID=UPI00280A7D2E|nr:DUF4230 domain-containing protein [uncultured Anaerococcus sp.]
MKKAKKMFFGLLALIVIIFGSYFIGMKGGLLKTETKVSSDIIKNQILSVKELTTLKYKYTNVGSFENQQEFYGMKLPFTQKKFIISYDGEVNAGINLEEAKVSLNEADKKINIQIPHAVILNHVIDEDSLTIFDEKNSIFNQLEVKDFSDFRKDEMKKIEKELEEKGFLQEADEKTKEAIVEILKINPLLEAYTIEFN